MNSWPSAELELLVAYISPCPEEELRAWNRRMTDGAAAIARLFSNYSAASLPFHEQPLQALLDIQRKFQEKSRSPNADLAKVCHNAAEMLKDLRSPILKPKRREKAESSDVAGFAPSTIVSHLAALWFASTDETCDRWVWEAGRLVTPYNGVRKIVLSTLAEAVGPLWEQRKETPAWETLNLAGVFASLGKEGKYALQLEDAILRYWNTFVLLYMEKSRTALPIPVVFTLGPRQRGPLVTFEGYDPERDKRYLRLRDDFRSGIERGVMSAKILWKKKHTLWPAEGVHDVAKAQKLTVDLTLALSVIKNVNALKSNMIAPISVSGRSAGLPAALSTFSQLLDRPHTAQILATGPVHTFDDEKRDALVSWMGDGIGEMVRAKVDVAQRYSTFERIILPKDEEDALLPLIERPGGLKVHPVQIPYLSNAADAFFERSWRRAHCVRAPDVAWLMAKWSSETGETPTPRPAWEEEIRTRLACDSVVAVTAENPRKAGLATVRALRGIYLDLFKDGIKWPNWVYVRFHGGEAEAGERFWNFLFEELGAYPEEVRRFHRERTWRGKAEVFADICNLLKPEWDKRGRLGPVTLILEGVERFHNPEDLFPSQAPYSVIGILRHLAAYFRNNPRDHLSLEGRWEQRLMARLVLVGNSCPEPLKVGSLYDTEGALPDLDPQVSENWLRNGDVAAFLALVRMNCHQLAPEVLLRASVFPEAFTSAGLYALFNDLGDRAYAIQYVGSLGAGAAFGVHSISCEDFGKEMTEAFGLLSKFRLQGDPPLIRQGQGVFHLAPALRELLYGAMLEKAKNDSEFANLLCQFHLRAGVHYSPILAETRGKDSGFPTVLRSSTFFARYRDAALHHLRQARSMEPKTPGTRSQAEELLDKQLKFAEPPGYSRSLWLFFRSKERELAIKDFILWAEENGFNESKWHPLWFSTLALAATSKEEAEDYFRKAKAALAGFNIDMTLPNEIQDIADHITIQESAYKCKKFDEYPQDIPQALNTLKRFLEAERYIKLDRLEAAGDAAYRLEDWGSAAYFYERGRGSESIYYQCWVKLIGLRLRVLCDLAAANNTVEELIAKAQVQVGIEKANQLIINGLARTALGTKPIYFAGLGAFQDRARRNGLL